MFAKLSIEQVPVNEFSLSYLLETKTDTTIYKTQFPYLNRTSYIIYTPSYIQLLECSSYHPVIQRNIRIPTQYIPLLQKFYKQYLPSYSLSVPVEHSNSLCTYLFHFRRILYCYCFLSAHLATGKIRIRSCTTSLPAKFPAYIEENPELLNILTELICSSLLPEMLHICNIQFQVQFK